jgi:hypothetical protein
VARQTDAEASHSNICFDLAAHRLVYLSTRSSDFVNSGKS